MRSVPQALAASKGVARVDTLRRAGYSRRAIDRSIAAGEVVRLRRNWLGQPTADPFLTAAVRGGVVLTCVTQAARLGLWVLTDDERPHVASAAHAGHIDVTATVHWSRPVVPRHPDAVEDGIENVLAIVATCQPYERALAVWESALRAGLVQRESLRRLELPTAARTLLEDAEIFSDSGIETFVVPRLRWLRLPMRRQAWIAGHRVDLLIGDRLVLQIDGGHHVGAQRDSDIDHDAQLMLRGYHVIRVTYAQVVDRWSEVQDLIMRAIAQGLHEAAR